MAKQRIALLGASALGRTALRLATDVEGVEVVAFYDDARRGDVVEGIQVEGEIADVVGAVKAGDVDAALLCVGTNHLRRRASIASALSDGGIPFATLVHPSAVLADGAAVAPGAIVFPGCVLDVGVQVGAHAVLNAGCTLAHDAHVGAHTFLGPGVTVSGFVRIGARCFVGVGTVIIDRIVLDDECQTGGGAVVVKDVPRHQLVVGVPARAAGVAHIARD